jgi:hypothetical protein
MFVDEQGQKVSNQRLQLVQGELVSRGLEVSFVEEEVEAASVSKGSVAVGEVADNLDADLVVLSTAGEQPGAADHLTCWWLCSAVARRGQHAMPLCGPSLLQLSTRSMWMQTCWQSLYLVRCCSCREVVHWSLNLTSRTFRG